MKTNQFQKEANMENSLLEEYKFQSSCETQGEYTEIDEYTVHTDYSDHM